MSNSATTKHKKKLNKMQEDKKTETLERRRSGQKLERC